MLSRTAKLERYRYRWRRPSVCLSVCLSQAGNMWRQMLIGSRGCHHQVARKLQFFETSFHALGPRKIHSAAASNETAVGKIAKNGDFRPIISRCISETIEHRHTA